MTSDQFNSTRIINYPNMNMENRRDICDPIFCQSYQRPSTDTLRPKYNGAEFETLFPTFPPFEYCKHKKKVRASNAPQNPALYPQVLCHTNQNKYTKKEPQLYNNKCLSLCSQVLEENETGVWLFVDHSNI